MENCGSTLILTCSASEHGGTAEFASRLIVHRGSFESDGDQHESELLGDVEADVGPATHELQQHDGDAQFGGRV